MLFEVYLRIVLAFFEKDHVGHTQNISFGIQISIRISLFVFKIFLFFPLVFYSLIFKTILVCRRVCVNIYDKTKRVFFFSLPCLSLHTFVYISDLFFKLLP